MACPDLTVLKDAVGIGVGSGSGLSRLNGYIAAKGANKTAHRAWFGMKYGSLPMVLCFVQRAHLELCLRSL